MASPNLGNKNKLNPQLKKTGCEVIIEEDEDKLKTEYRSSKKFFDLENFKNRESANSMHSIHSLNLMNSVKSMCHDNLKKEFQTNEDLNIFVRANTENHEDKERDEEAINKDFVKAIDEIYKFENKSLIKPNELNKVSLTYTGNRSNINSTLIKRNLLPIVTKIQKNQQISQESTDSPSTREFTLDSAKVLKSITPERQLNSSSNTKRKSISRTSSKNKLQEGGNREPSTINFKETPLSANSNMHVRSSNKNLQSNVFTFNMNFPLKSQTDNTKMNLHSEDNPYENDENFNSKKENKINHEKKKSSFNEYNAISLKYTNNKNLQNINLNLYYNSNTEKDKSKPRKDITENYSSNNVNKIQISNSLYNCNPSNNQINSCIPNNDSQCFSPRRKLQSNPNQIGFIDDKLPTERVHSYNSFNTNHTLNAKSRSKISLTRLNTDRAVSAEREDSENTLKRDTYSSNPRENSNKIKRSNTRVDMTNSKQEFRFNKEDLNKPVTPPDMNLRKLDILPVISTNRRKLNKDQVAYDISSVFKEANNFKEDPIVQKKMEDIIQNIDDIRNVINQKAKNRMKISSAPISHNQKYSFKGASGIVNYDLNKNKSKLIGDFKVNNNINFDKKVNFVAGNYKVPVKLKNLQQ